MNDRPLAVSTTPTLDESLLATGFPYNIREAPDNNLKEYAAFSVRARAVRRLGSAVLYLAWLACGRLDGYWELRLGPWDVAAGSLLVEEAGGRVTDLTGGTLDLDAPSLVATNGHIHSAVLDVLEAGPGRQAVTPSVARRLARFVIALEFKDLPAPVIDQAGLLTLDTLGCCLAASRHDFGAPRARPPSASAASRRAPWSAVECGSPPPTRYSPTRPWLTGSTSTTRVRTRSCTRGRSRSRRALPSARRPARRGARRYAVVAAVEVMCRVGLAVPANLHARHYHPTALTGTFAAAAAAGKLYGLTEDQLVRAFGICGSQTAGIIEYLADGTWTKRFAPGWSAHAGIVAALLAAVRVHRARVGLRGRARVLSRVRGRRPDRAARRAAHRPRPRLGARATDLQALSVRLDRRSRTWTARCGSETVAACAPRTSSRSDAGPPRDRCRASGSRSRPSTRRRMVTRRSSACPISWR